MVFSFCRSITMAFVSSVVASTLTDAAVRAQVWDAALPPYPTMTTVLHRTVFRIAVVAVEVRVDESTARRLKELASHSSQAPGIANRLAHVAIQAEHASVQITFLRNVTMQEFVEGAQDDLDNALAAGMISTAEYVDSKDSLVLWYAPLTQRGFRAGDVLHYQVDTTSLDTQVFDKERRLLLNVFEAGAQAKHVLLSTYFAPNSTFRDGLLQSLF